MAKRKKLDWEGIERDFRAGILSIIEIARRNGCSDAAIHRKAKQFGWTRALDDKVRLRARAKLVRDELRKASAETSDEDVIEEAAETIAAIQRLHRKDIRQLRELESKLIAELLGDPTKLYVTQYQGEIVEKELCLTASERAQAANNLANVQHKRIQLERQAYSMNDQDTNEDEKVTKIVYEIVASPNSSDDGDDGEDA